MEPNVIRVEKRAAMVRRYVTISLTVALFYAVICTPANLLVNSNVLLLQTILPLFVDIVMTFANFLFYWVSFSFLLYFMFEFGFGESKPFFLSYCAVVCGRYVLNLLAGYVVMGFPTFGAFFSNEFLFLLIDIVMDLVLQMGIALLILRKTVGEHCGFDNYMPAVRLLDFANPLQKSAFFITLIPSAISLLLRLLYDVRFGFPQSFTDLLWMISYYLSDLLSVLIGYVVILLILGSIYNKNKSWNEELNR